MSKINLKKVATLNNVTGEDLSDIIYTIENLGYTVVDDDHTCDCRASYKTYHICIEI